MSVNGRICYVFHTCTLAYYVHTFESIFTGSESIDSRGLAYSYRGGIVMTCVGRYAEIRSRMSRVTLCMVCNVWSDTYGYLIIFIISHLFTIGLLLPYILKYHLIQL